MIYSSIIKSSNELGEAVAKRRKFLRYQQSTLAKQAAITGETLSLPEGYLLHVLEKQFGLPIGASPTALISKPFGRK